jgi:transposase-like protein
MPDKHKSNDFKQAAINHYLNVSNNLLETSRIMGCNNKTLGRWVDRFEEAGNLERQNRVAVSYKITENQVNYAVNYLSEHKTMSMAELHGVMLGHFPNFDVTADHLGNIGYT